MQPLFCAQSGDEHISCCLEVPALHMINFLPYAIFIAGQHCQVICDSQHKINPRTGHKAPYSFLNQMLNRVGWSMLQPGRFISLNAQRACQLRPRCIGTIRSQTQLQINYPMETDLTPTVQKAGWAPFLFRMGAENFAPHCNAISGPSSTQQIAILSVLSRPMFSVNVNISTACVTSQW